MTRKHLTPDQTARLNATLKRLAEDLERKKAERLVANRVPEKPSECGNA